MFSVWSVPRGTCLKSVMERLDKMGCEPILGNDLLIYLDSVESAIYTRLATDLNLVCHT